MCGRRHMITRIRASCRCNRCIISDYDNVPVCFIVWNGLADKLALYVKQKNHNYIDKKVSQMLYNCNRNFTETLAENAGFKIKLHEI